MLMTLEQAKENPLDCEEFQLKNWLSQFLPCPDSCMTKPLRNQIDEKLFIFKNCL